MKKKTLLFSLLALAIVTSLTAGTLAIYTKSVTLSSKVDIKKFAFTAGGASDSVNKPIKLAPSEQETYTFSVTNEDNKVTSEVDLDYVIKIDIADAAKQMTGLTASLSLNDKTLDTTPLTGQDIGKLTYTATEKLPASKSTTVNYVVTLLWEAGTDDEHTTAGLTVTETKGLTVEVTATQSVNK